MTHVPFIEEEPPTYCVGLLGATCHSAAHGQGARTTMIERRILRIEMALRRAGIEVEHLDLPK